MRFLLLLILSACAQDRWLTAEQDAKMKEMCEPAGCEVIPSPTWAHIEALLKRLGAI